VRDGAVIAMKLIANVTIEPGPIKPGEAFEVKDKVEAEALIARGFASPPPAPKAKTEDAEGADAK